MHGARGGEEDSCKRRRHMLPVPSPATGAPTSQPQPSAGASPPAVNFSDTVAVQSASDCFLKDGRRIQVGDCALFQAGNAPPFIGIIRRFSTSKENHLKLCVNWLYRPADVKLAKGVLLEAAPNEVFYSFHRDVISAVSLLHPCKVAFLRKGVELPPGLSSFVCRRVYDIENKCLWWLTDQDYINERQEEVDQLLDRTRLEMNVVQSGGRSPKPLNGTAATQQLKSGSDSVQNSGTSFSSQGKGKKRDRGDQGTEPIKRERSAKMEDVDNASSRTDSPVKAEVAKITEKSGLFTLDGVEKLVDLMQRERAEKKMDLTDRMLLAGVIAATDNTDCLVKFVQLRGVPVLDDWLQEVHKGKAGDGSSLKESDKAVEMLVLTLLRALDKLPVNLNALQTCNIGKSVNHLRSHKNLEIQKKARSLVDTWKKRVDLEIKNHDAKNTGSSQVPWPGKSSYSEVPNAGNRRGGSTEMAMKSSATQPSIYRSLSGKTGHADVIMKSAPVTVGSLKLQAASTAAIAVGTKDLLLKAAGSSGTPELPQPKVKEEKSSSSSQSQNNSQSCSSDHAKTISSSWKEDAKSSTAGSMNASKASGGSSRHKRPSNGVLGTSTSGVQKDTNFGKSGFLNRTTTLDKVSHSGLICESTVDMRVSDHGNGHRFILKLPNMGRSAALNGNRGTLEDQSVVGSRASSPVTSDKHDNKIKVKNEPCWSNIAVDVSAEKWHNNDCKEGLLRSDEGEPSPTAILDEDRSADEPEKATNVPKSACSTSGNEKGVLVEPKARDSFSSMNALIESCADYSEVNVPLSAGDDVGMNLLAAVAAGEMSQSPRRSPAREDSCGGNNESNLRPCDDGKTPNLQSVENTDVDSEKLAKTVGSSLTKDELPLVATDISGDNVNIRIMENKLTGEENGQQSVSSGYTNKAANSSVKSEGKLEGAGKCLTACAFSETKEELDHHGALQHQDKQSASELVTESPMNGKLKAKGSTVDENKSMTSHEKVAEGNTYTSDFNCDSAGVECHSTTHSSRNPQNLVADGLSSCPPVDIEMQTVGTSTEQQQSMVDSHAENAERTGDVASGSSGVDKSESVDLEARNSDILQIGQLEPDDTEQNKPATHVPKIFEGDPGSVLPSASNMGGVEMNLDRKEALDNHPAGSDSRESSPTLPVQETDKCIKSSASKLSVADIDKDAFSPSPEASSKVVFESEVAVKLDFDLNEGIPGDDGNQNEQAASVAAVCPSSMHLPCLPSFSSSPIANGSSAIITVAAPAKGPFVPPENLLRSKAEAGWKGSAATSAFRPAEPRRVLEIPLAADVLSSGTASEKHGRVPLDIDLNVADDRVLDDMDSQSSAQTMGSESGAISNRDASVRSSGGLDLDLNKVDEGTENNHILASTSRKFDVPLLPVRPASGGFPGGEANMLRDFDLNNGPNIDELGTDSLARSQHAKSNTSVPFLPPVAGLRMNTAEFGSVSSWFPPGNSYPAIAIPSFLSDRGEQPPYPVVAAAGTQRILGSVSGGGTFGGDIYKGPVLQSSPAMAFSHGTAFPYAGFPFGSSFPVTSTPFSGVSTTYVDSTSGGGLCFPAIPSQLVGPAGAVSASYPRPYMLSLPEGNVTGGSESSRKWGRQALDLNAGPGSAEMDGKDERLAAASRQLYVANSQGFAEEQPRIYQVAGGGLKRKDPEAGLDAERYAYKQRTWQ